MKFIRILALVLTFATFSVQTAVTQDRGKDSLKGIKTFKIEISYGSDKAKDYLSDAEMRDFLTKSLTNLNVKVIDTLTFVDVPYNATIDLKVDAKPVAGKTFAYQIEMAVRQNVTIKRMGVADFIVPAKTWLAPPAFGLVTSDAIKNGVNKNLDANAKLLAIDWLAAQLP